MEKSIMCHINNPELNENQKINKHEIMLVVKFNSGEGFVLKEPVKLIYYKFGTDTIIGTDGVFYTFYMKDWAAWSKDAFGGREFTLTMHDGEEVLFEGQWWDAISPTARMLMEGTSMVHTTANGLSQLQNCYVYSGYQADTVALSALRATYTGPVYEYYEGETIINSWKKKHGKLIKLFRDYKGELSAIDEHHDHYEIRTIKGYLYLRYRSHIKPDDWYNRIFTDGVKDFSVKEPREKPEYHNCKMCGSDDATLHYFENDYYCHRCDKEMTRKDEISNYY